MRIGTLIGLFALAAACGESDSAPPASGGGSSGNASGGSAGVGASSGAGAQSGSGGTASGGTSGTGGSSQGGSNSGGSAGTGAAGSSGAGTGGADWDSSCGATMNGHCNGDVYEWCDFFSRTLSRLDCAAFGMRCEATPTQWYEEELNGCVGDPCTQNLTSCDLRDGNVLVSCVRGAMRVQDCRRRNGPDSRCAESAQSAACTRLPCEPNTRRCEGTMAVYCTEDGVTVLSDCRRCDPEGTCIADPNDTQIGGRYCSVPTMGCGTPP